MLKIADFGLTRNVLHVDYYRKKSDVSLDQPTTTFFFNVEVLSLSDFHFIQKHIVSHSALIFFGACNIQIQADTLLEM